MYQLVLFLRLVSFLAADLYLRHEISSSATGPCHGVCAWPRLPILDTATPFGGGSSSCPCVIVAAVTCNETSIDCKETVTCNATGDEVNDVIQQNLQTLVGLSLKNCPRVEKIDHFPPELKLVSLVDNAALSYLPSNKLWNLTKLRLLHVEDNSPALRVPFNGGKVRV